MSDKYSWQQVAKVMREFFGMGDMAEEILRLRDENAALRAAVEAAEREVDEDDQNDTDKEITAMADAAYERATLRAAVAAAEQEATP